MLRPRVGTVRSKYERALDRNRLGRVRTPARKQNQNFNQAILHFQAFSTEAMCLNYSKPDNVKSLF